MERRQEKREGTKEALKTINGRMGAGQKREKWKIKGLQEMTG